MEAKFEKVISRCNSIDDIRKEVENVPGLKEAVLDSVEPVKALISSLFMRLSLKDKGFRCFNAATTHEIEGLFDHLHDIESDLTTTGQGVPQYTVRNGVYTYPGCNPVKV